ncbi:MAG: aspartate 1-decarboxylase [Gemmataceae bacterium]
MRRTVLKSKLHRATVTAAALDYEGSLTIDSDLLDAADILPHEQIHVWDVTNGTRLVTYALPGDRGSGVVQVNGAGAHLVKTGDVVIIATFTTLPTKRAKKHKPQVVFVDAQNRARSEAPAATVTPAEANGEAAPEKPRRRKKGSTETASK